MQQPAFNRFRDNLSIWQRSPARELYLTYSLLAAKFTGASLDLGRMVRISNYTVPDEFGKSGKIKESGWLDPKGFHHRP